MHKLVERDSKSLIRSNVRDSILRWIFEGLFHADEHLSVNRLSQLVNASDTPVRESLIELAGLGVIESLPNGRTIVKPFGPLQLHHMCQVMKTLEAEAVRCACGKISEQELNLIQSNFERIHKTPVHRQLKQRVEIASRRSHAKTAETFHAMIAARCGNSWLTIDVQRYLILFTALRKTSYFCKAWNRHHQANEIAGHLRIVEALQSVNSDGATRAMEDYIDSLHKAVEAVLFASGQVTPIDASHYRTNHRAKDARVRSSTPLA